MRVLIRFNGAAHERERMPDAGVTLSRSHASMEPPTNVSGCRTRTAAHLRDRCFNGAAHERERMLGAMA